MVEDMFTSRIKDEFPYSSKTKLIKIQDPIDKLVFDVKKALEEYNNYEKNKISIKILEGNREIGILSS